MEGYVRVTDVVEYLICPRKVYLKRVLGLEEETKKEMLFGKIVHEVFEILNKKERDIIYSILEPLTFSQIYKLYYDYVSKIVDEILEQYSDDITNLELERNSLKLDILNSIEYEIYDRAVNTYNIMSHLDVYGIELWDNLFPKILSEVEVLSDRAKIVGRIDRIEDYGSFIVPVEIKTSNSMRSIYLHKIQLALYKYLLFENFPKKRVGPAYVYYTKLKKKKEVKISQSLIRKALEIKDKVLNMIENEKDPGIINKKFCKRCPFYNVCYKTI